MLDWLAPYLMQAPNSTSHLFSPPLCSLPGALNPRFASIIALARGTCRPRRDHNLASLSNTICIDDGVSHNLKRKLSSATRAVSPPATRRKVSPTVRETERKPTLSLKIVSWNVNGIGPLLQKPLSFDGTARYPLREFLERHHWPALLCLQEVKIASKDLATQRAVHVAANAGLAADEPEYRVFFSLPRDKYNATGFGGKAHGVATLARNDVITHGIDATDDDGIGPSAKGSVTEAVPWDLEGRVLITLLPDYTTGRKLAVINGYWVNGTDNAYRDPVTGKISGTRHEHKLRFHQHMLEECRRLEQEDYQVILVGDMNIAPSRIDGHPNLRTSPVQHVRNRADFTTRFLGDKGWGVDVFRALHGSKRKYTYHPRRGEWGASCDRVDLIVAGRSLMDCNAVVDCDIEDSPEERGHSDHIPLWVRIDATRLKPRNEDAQEE
jgi:exonuclease III